MTKLIDWHDMHAKELDEYALTLGIELDRRKTREDMLLEFEAKAKEQGVDITMVKRKKSKKVEQPVELEAEEVEAEAPVEPEPEALVEEKPVVKLDGMVAKVDINPTYRKGDVVPMNVYDKWKEVGFDVDAMFE